MFRLYKQDNRRIFITFQERVMKDIFKEYKTKLDKPLDWRSRLLVFLAALLLIPTMILPLWHMTFVSQQYPEGLDLYIYPYNIVGGDRGNDLVEINVLNHYIGMAELKKEDFSEFKWIPLFIGLFGIITLRAAAIGTFGSVLDVLMVFIYFSLFSLVGFYRKLYIYGHELDPKASVQVEPFTPPVFGHKMVGQFDVWSYPAGGTWFFALFVILLVASFFFIRSRPGSHNISDNNSITN